MQTFSYKAFNKEGRLERGRIDAVDIADAQRKLRAGGLSVADIAAGFTGSARPRRLFPDLSRSFDLTRFFTDLGVLMSAGLGIDQALRAVHGASSRPASRLRIETMMDRLSSGASPTSALSVLENLPQDALALIASGERSGRLGFTIQVVASDLQQRDTRRKQLIDALIYPLFLLAMVFLAVGIVTFVLVPSLEPIFETSGRPVPFIVDLLSGLRNALLDPLVLLGSLGLAISVAAAAVVSPDVFRNSAAVLVLKVPVVGKALSDAALARYLQSLSLLLKNAVPLPEALGLSARCCPTIAFREPLSGIQDKVIAGKKLPEALAACGLFADGVVALVTIGDEVNKLAIVLDNASAILRSDAQRTYDRLITLLTPAITIFLGLLVGSLVTSVMTALLSINELGLQ